MSTIYLNKRNYWGYQYKLGTEFIIPLLQSWLNSIKLQKVLDIGCAEGGLVCAFKETGAFCTGLEVSLGRLRWAKQLAAERQIKIDFIAADFLYSPIKLNTPHFDLIILCDVIEHLPQKSKSMEKLVSLMSKDTYLLLTFPPFYSPFGGHQQMLQSALRRIPYFHILPEFIWWVIRRYILKRDPNADFLHEMENLRRHRISISLIKRLCKRNGLEIVGEKYYISRPSYKLRFGWPIISAGLLAKIPIINEMFVTGVTILLKKR